MTRRYTDAARVFSLRTPPGEISLIFNDTPDGRSSRLNEPGTTLGFPGEFFHARGDTVDFDSLRRGEKGDLNFRDEWDIGWKLLITRNF